MAYTIPNQFSTQAGNVPASQIDSNFTTCINAINGGFLTGTLAARPAVDGIGNGRYYFATDVAILYRDNGTAWVQVASPGNSTTQQTLTDGATVNWSVTSGAVATWTIGGNRTLAGPTGLGAGGLYTLLVTQDATGSRTITWNSVYKGYSGQAPRQPSTGAGDVTAYHFVSPDGINLIELAPPLIPRSWLSGLVLSANSSTGTMTIAAGQCADNGNNVLINASALWKTTGAWTVGSGNGALDTGSIANATWYHWYVIMRVDTGVQDYLCSLSATAPTLPASYNYFRRIGSALTDGSAHWTTETQDGDYFWWVTPAAVDFSTTNPGTTAIVASANVPPGVRVQALLNVDLNQGTTGGTAVYISDTANADVGASLTVSPLGTVVTNTAANGTVGFGPIPVRVNTTQQYRYRLAASDGTTVIRAATIGRIDRRGRDA